MIQCPLKPYKIIIIYSNWKLRSQSFSFVIWGKLLNENLAHGSDIIAVWILFVKNTGEFHTEL